MEDFVDFVQSAVHRLPLRRRKRQRFDRVLEADLHVPSFLRWIPRQSPGDKVKKRLSEMNIFSGLRCLKQTCQPPSLMSKAKPHFSAVWIAGRVRF